MTRSSVLSEPVMENLSKDRRGSSSKKDFQRKTSSGPDDTSEVGSINDQSAVSET